MRLHRRLPVAALAAASIAALALGLAACAADPPTRFHSLLPGEPAPNPTPGGQAGGPPLAISLAALRVPAQVDQPQWLIRLADGSLQLLEQDRWAAPLRDELHAALLEALAQRWGAVDSRTAVATSAAQVWRIVVDVTRFESVLGREARLEARWSVAGSAAGAPAIACASTLREAAGSAVNGLAQAHQRAVVRLADAIGGQLRALSRNQAGRCEATAG